MCDTGFWQDCCFWSEGVGEKENIGERERSKYGSGSRSSVSLNDEMLVCSRSLITTGRKLSDV